MGLKLPFIYEGILFTLRSINRFRAIDMCYSPNFHQFLLKINQG